MSSHNQEKDLMQSLIDAANAKGAGILKYSISPNGRVVLYFANPDKIPEYYGSMTHAFIHTAYTYNLHKRFLKRKTNNSSDSNFNSGSKFKKNDLSQIEPIFNMCLETVIDRFGEIQFGASQRSFFEETISGIIHSDEYSESFKYRLKHRLVEFFQKRYASSHKIIKNRISSIFKSIHRLMPN